MIAASTVVKIAGLPFNGTLGAVKVGFDGKDYLLNPTSTELETSKLDLTVAGTSNAVLMVESEADQLTESEMLNAVNFGHEKMQSIIQAIDELVSDMDVTQQEAPPAEDNSDLYNKIKQSYGEQISSACRLQKNKFVMRKLSHLKEDIKTKELDEDEDNSDKLSKVFEALKKDIVRERILSGEKRIDGRDTKTVRPISVRTGILAANPWFNFIYKR